MIMHALSQKEGIVMSDEGTIIFERLAVLETQMDDVKDGQKAHKEETARKFDKMDTKLDAILMGVNRNRGRDAVLAFLGTGLITGIVYLITRAVTGGNS